MPIISKSSATDGRLVSLSYTFNDGTVRVLRVRGNNAAALLLHHEASVLKSKRKTDIDLLIQGD